MPSFYVSDEVIIVQLLKVQAAFIWVCKHVKGVFLSHLLMTI